MNEPTSGDERLRKAFASLALDAPPRADCPEPEHLWEAHQGDLPPDEIRSLIDHVSDCPSCAEDWRLARELQREEETSAETSSPLRMRAQRARRPAWIWGVAVAAVLTLVLALQWIRPQVDSIPDVDPIYRASEGIDIQALAPEQPLSRQEPVLRWTPVGEDAVYHLLVSNSDFDVLHEARDLPMAEARLPITALENLTSGEEIYWRVEAELPGKEPINSPTFVVRLE